MILSAAHNKRVSGFGLRFRPNLLRFAPQTSDTHQTLGETAIDNGENEHD